MRHILVVAHKTLGGQHLLEELAARMQGGACAVHLVVPVNHPFGSFTESSLLADAEAVLEEGLRRIRALDPTGAVDVTGEVGDANPVYAVGAAMRSHPDEDWAGIIVSTLPRHLSRWLGLDAVSRLEREYEDLPVTHLEAAQAPADA